ncbi:MAG: ABC transporter substrate-binding protein [Chloroflexota bacterium]
MSSATLSIRRPPHKLGCVQRIFTTVFLAISLLLAPALPVESATLRVAIPGLSYVIAAIEAKEKGYYREENLDVELVHMPVGLGVNALIAGNVDFAAMGSGLFSAILGGAPLRIIMNSFQRPLFFLYGSSELKTLGDLKGKRIGVPALGTAGHAMLVEILERNKHDSERDVILVGIGNTATRLQSLLNGVIDAAVLSPPSTFHAEEAGFNQILSFVKQDLVFPGGGIGVHEKMLQKNFPLVKRFARATLKGHYAVLADETGTIPILSKTLRLDSAHAGKYYRAMREAMTPDGTIDGASQKKALAPALRLRGSSAPPMLQGIFDFALLHKLGAELKAAGWRP